MNKRLTKAQRKRIKLARRIYARQSDRESYKAFRFTVRKKS